MPQGQWRNTRLYEDVTVAAEYKREVSWLWGLEENEQALIIAQHRASGTVRAYADWLHEKKMEAAAKKKK